MKTRWSLVIGALLLVFFCNGQNLEIRWSKQFVRLHNTAEIKGIKTDFIGNVIIAGTFRDSVVFATNSNQQVLSNGHDDIFICKYNSFGQLLWYKTVGGPNKEVFFSLDVDSAGSVYISAAVRSHVDVDPSPNRSVFPTGLNGNYRGYFQKLNSLGDVQWTHWQQRATNSPEQINIIADWSSGQCYLEGLGIASFISRNQIIHKGATGFNLSISAFPPGVDLYDIAVDHDTVYVTGKYSQATNFNLSIIPAVMAQPSSSVQDLFLAKYAPGFDLEWLQLMMAGTTDCKSEIELDDQGHLYNYGLFKNYLSIPANAPSFYSTNNYPSAYVHRIATNGQSQWVRTIENLEDFDIALDTDISGNPHISGVFGTTVDFDPDTSTSYSLSPIGKDIFLSQWNASGNMIWTQAFNGQGLKWNTSFHIDRKTLFLAGKFNRNVNVDSISPNHALQVNNPQYFDGFVARWQQCSIKNGVETITACDSIVWRDGLTYSNDDSTAQFYTLTSEGCDSIITLNLNIERSEHITDSILTCSSYLWRDGRTYEKDTIVESYTVSNATSCDSIFRLVLDINRITGLDSTESCAPFNFNGNSYHSGVVLVSDTFSLTNGCDSIHNRHVQIHSIEGHDSIEVCSPYTFNGITYYNGIVLNTDTFSLASGCDSIHERYTEVIAIDTNLRKLGIAVSSLQYGASYQWLDCLNNMSPIPGATSQQYFVTSNGSYAVAIDFKGCRDTSVCAVYGIVSVDEFENSIDLQIQPNPFDGQFQIIYDGTGNVDVEIYNPHGQLVFSRTLAKRENLISINGASGVYILKAKASNSPIAVIKLIKN